MAGQPVIKKLAPPRKTQKAQLLAPQAKSIFRSTTAAGGALRNFGGLPPGMG